MDVICQDEGVLVFAAAILLYWLIQAAVMMRRLKRDPVLNDSPGPLPSPPLVSIILPVRNEEHNIEECVSSLLAQDYPNCELIVIDDRSADRTVETIKRLEEENKRVRLIVNRREPPPDWSGQVYANAEGAREARGEWLVFTDADTRHHPAHIQAAMEYCLKNGVELLTVFPGMECPTFWEKVIQPFVFWLFWDYYSPASVNRPRSRRGGACGTFFLMRKEAYERMGGWASVHNCIPDDLAFMERAKELNLPAHLIIGTRTLRVRMYRTLPESFEGWSRYMLSGANNNILLALLAILYLLVFNLLPFLFFLFLPCQPGLSFILLAAALLIFCIRFRINRLFQVQGRWAITHILASAVLIVVFLNTLYRRIAGKGVSWKGRIYIEEGRSIFWRGKRYHIAPRR